MAAEQGAQQQCRSTLDIEYYELCIIITSVLQCILYKMGKMCEKSRIYEGKILF